MQKKHLIIAAIIKKLLFVAVLFFSSNADAGTLTISEIKGGLLTQSSSILDADNPGEFWRQKDETGGSVNGEILFNGPSFLHHIYTPRLNVGLNISTTGQTDYAYTGLQWDRDLTDHIFAAGFFGFMVHDGVVSRSPSDPRYNTTRMLGSRVLFRLGPEIGYKFDEHNSLMITYAHSSNGWILNGFDVDGHNEGLDQIGLRYGHKF